MLDGDKEKLRERERLKGERKKKGLM